MGSTKIPAKRSGRHWHQCPGPTINIPVALASGTHRFRANSINTHRTGAWSAELELGVEGEGTLGWRLSAETS